MPEIITRQAARAAGLVRYFTGRPCKHGHVAERGIAGGCLGCSHVGTMTLDQIERNRARRLLGNLTLDQIERNRARHRIETMTTGQIIQGMLHQAKYRAKNQGVPFNLTATDLGGMPAVCPVLGIPLLLASGKMTENSPTLDRIIPHLGYVPGNVVIISNLANRIKNSATPWQLMQVVAYATDQTFRAP